MKSCLPFALASVYWLLAAVMPELRRLQIGPVLESLLLQVFQFDCHRAVFQFARDIVFGGH